VQKTGGPMFMIYCTSYDEFLRKELPFVGRGDWQA